MNGTFRELSEACKNFYSQSELLRQPENQGNANVELETKTSPS